MNAIKTMAGGVAGVAGVLAVGAALAGFAGLSLWLSPVLGAGFVAVLIAVNR